MTDTSAARHTLLPCPWCNGETKRYDCIVSPDPRTAYWNGCDKSDCPGFFNWADWPTRELADAAWNRRVNTHDELLAALKALMPEGWGVDDTMDHMPGVKQARVAIARAEGKST